MIKIDDLDKIVFNKMKICALIPLRGGSKGIKKKNIKMFGHRPLAFWCVEAAESSKYISDVFIATESKEIREVIKKFKMKKVKFFERSMESATDEAPTELVLMEFVKKTMCDVVVLIQVTNPFLTSQDLDEAIRQYIRAGYDSMLSAVEVKYFLWDKKGNNSDIVKPSNYDIHNRPRRQEFTGFYIENGAFYINKRINILRDNCRLSGGIGIYKMGKASLFELDDMEDWRIAENIFKAQRLHIKRFFKQELKSIKILILDVDGVLTDGGVYVSSEGEEFIKFNRIDGKGIELFKKSGREVIAVSSENSGIVKKRLDKLGVEYYGGVKDKWEEIKGILEKKKFCIDNVAFMGDDVQDLETMEHIRFSFCPSNAVDIVKQKAFYVCNKYGGHGAVREVVDLILYADKDR